MFVYHFLGSCPKQSYSIHSLRLGNITVAIWHLLSRWGNGRTEQLCNLSKVIQWKLVELGLVTCACIPRTREAEAGGWSHVWGRHGLHSIFQVSQGDIVRLYSKTNKQQVSLNSNQHPHLTSNPLCIFLGRNQGTEKALETSQKASSDFKRAYLDAERKEIQWRLVIKWQNPTKI